MQDNPENQDHKENKVLREHQDSLDPQDLLDHRVREENQDQLGIKENRYTWIIDIPISNQKNDS